MRAALRVAAIAFIVAFCAQCGNDSDPTPLPRAAVVGTLSSKLKGRLGRHVRLTPYTGGNDLPVFVQGRSVAALGSDTKAGIRKTYQAGLSVVVLDADPPALAFLDALLADDVGGPGCVPSPSPPRRCWPWCSGRPTGRITRSS